MEQITRRMMLSGKDFLEKNEKRKNDMYFLGLIGFGVPEVRFVVDKDTYEAHEKGQELDVVFDLKEMIKTDNYGKATWGFKPIISGMTPVKKK